jgi:hypothetical protein
MFEGGQQVMKKILPFLIIGILVFSSIEAVAAQEENNTNHEPLQDPEIVDDVGDTPLGLLDIEAAWFYEQANEPDYLFTAMKIHMIKENYNAVFSIRWSYDGKDYAAGVNTFYLRDTIFRSGLPKRATYWQWNHMPKCEGILDIEERVITWKIPKSSIGDPQPGEVLTNTKANAVPGFPLSFLYFVMQLDYRDFAPDNVEEYGHDYVVQY